MAAEFLGRFGLLKAEAPALQSGWQGLTTAAADDSGATLSCDKGRMARLRATLFTTTARVRPQNGSS